MLAIISVFFSISAGKIGTIERLPRRPITGIYSVNYLAI